MEKLFAGLTVIIVVLSFSCGFLLFIVGDTYIQNGDLKNQIEQLESQMEQLGKQIDDLEQQIYQKELSAARQVKIEKMKMNPPIEWGYLGLTSSISVTIKNCGSNPVEGLALLAGFSYSNEVTSSNTKTIEVLEAGVTKTLGFQAPIFGTPPTHFTLMFNDVILDQQKYTE